MIVRLPLVVLLAVSLAAPLCAQDAPFLNINPSWSPDGRWLVFQSDRNGVHTQLYIIGADGTNERRLTTNGASDTHPVWSPDGQWILFDSDRDGTWNLYVIRPDGTGERRLTQRGSSSAAAFARHPGWCAGGTRIVFDSDRDGDEEIYVMNADGTNPRRLTHAEGRDSHASCAPDGKIVFGSARKDGRGMWTIDPDGTNERRIIENGSAAKVSPDGRRILYRAPVGGKPDLFVMNRDGSSPRNLTNDPFTNYEHAWSPDGSRIAYYSDDTGRFELYVMNADGSGRRQLTDGSYQNSAPRWSPDGRSIVFTSNRDGGWKTYRMNADGSAASRLTWSAGSDAHPSFTADGARVVFASSRDYATDAEADLYAMSAQGKETKRILAAAGLDAMAAPSPDGTRIAFLRQSRGGETWELRVVDADGKNERQVASGLPRRTPRWTRDARHIVVVRDGRVLEVDPVTLAVTPLAHARGEVIDAAFAPDGSALAFVSARDGGRDLYRLDVASGAVTRLTTGITVQSQPDWSSDGQRIVFSGS
ncbi:MAG TPA: DUF5050 domain-containing protein, partial [Thermoanaerobaculia bacterium]|nr:DUF5050 domain-containing protein [Thermoanaerobaculia bacterium]